MANLQRSSKYILDMQPGSYDCRVVLRDDAEPLDVLRAAVEAHVTSSCLQVILDASHCKLEDLQTRLALLVMMLKQWMHTKANPVWAALVEG